jgi:hypothetical protein
VIVRYDGGPDLVSPGVADQIAKIVWANEFDTFDLLAIESRGATTAFAYQDLAQRFGPQLHSTGLSVEEFCGVRFDLNFDKGLGGAGALAVIFLAAIGIVSALGLLIATIPKRIAEQSRARKGKRR